MTTTAPDLDTASSVLDWSRARRADADRAEADLMVGAVRWANLHPAASIDDAAVLERVELQFRLPRVWARILAGDLPAWRGRRIARATIRLTGDHTVPHPARTRPGRGRRRARGSR